MSASCSEPRLADTPQVDAPPSESPRTVLLTRSAAQGAAFARALAEEICERLRQRELDESALKLLVHARTLGDRDAEHGVGIRAEQHEARLTEGEQAREAVEQVHRDGDEGIDRGLLDDLDDDVIAGEDGVEVDARAEQNEQDDGDDERFAMQFFRHDVHLLTLYR